MCRLGLILHHSQIQSQAMSEMMLLQITLHYFFSSRFSIQANRRGKYYYLVLPSHNPSILHVTKLHLLPTITNIHGQKRPSDFPALRRQYVIRRHCIPRIQSLDRHVPPPQCIHQLSRHRPNLIPTP